MWGVAVLKEHEWNTSKTSSRCGDDAKSNRVERGLYVCSSCELVANTDCNGAETMRQKITPSPHGENKRTPVWHSHRHTCLTARAGRFTRENTSCRRPANVPPAAREASSSGSARPSEGSPIPLRLRRGGCHALCFRRIYIMLITASKVAVTPNPGDSSSVGSVVLSELSELVDSTTNVIDRSCAT